MTGPFSAPEWRIRDSWRSARPHQSHAPTDPPIVDSTLQISPSPTRCCGEPVAPRSRVGFRTWLDDSPTSHWRRLPFSEICAFHANPLYSQLRPPPRWELRCKICVHQSINHSTIILPSFYHQSINLSIIQHSSDRASNESIRKSINLRTAG